MLEVKGSATAEIIVNITYFSMSFATQPQAAVITGNGQTDCMVTYGDGIDVRDDVENIPLAKILKSKYVDDDGETIETGEVEKAFCSGKSILKTKKADTAK